MIASSEVIDGGLFVLVLTMNLSDLKPDSRNANKGTQRGLGMVEKSLRQYGAGRSILTDKDGNVIAGNKTLEAAVNAGFENIRVVETDGSELVVVKRTDIKADSKRGRELAIADNRTAEVGLDWDADVLESLIDEGVDLTGFFNDNEIALITGSVELPDDPRELWGNTVDMGTEANAHRQLTIYFKEPEHVEAFSALLEQTIHDTTKSLWYPAKKE